jgi:hypothetical protein
MAAERLNAPSGLVSRSINPPLRIMRRLVLPGTATA